MQGIRLPIKAAGTGRTGIRIAKRQSSFFTGDKNDSEQGASPTSTGVQENNGEETVEGTVLGEGGEDPNLLAVAGSPQREVREVLGRNQGGVRAQDGVRVGERTNQPTGIALMRRAVVREAESSVRGIAVGQHSGLHSEGQTLHSVETVKSSFFHCHAHSMYSINDALPSVKDMVSTAVKNGQDALALTDHGAMGGLVQLYQECKKAGIAPYPGVELYFVPDIAQHKAHKTKRYHTGLLAFSRAGYEALVRLGSRSHRRENVHFKPLIDFTDLAEWNENGWTDGLAITTGCYFGLLTQTLIRDGEKAARHVLQRYASMIPNTFVELQNHQIERTDVLSEDEIAVALFGLAQELGLPVVIAQDAHYCDATDKPVHEALKRAVAFGPDPDDAVFPGDSYHLAGTEWVRQHHQSRHWEEAENGFRHLRDLHDLAIPELDNYRYNIPVTVPDPMATLRDFCRLGMESKGLDGQKVYEERLTEELAVLNDVGFAGYLLMVKEVTDWCAKNHVFTQTRGSASGSLVCWLLNITQINPIKFNLTFEQFISRDRAKPPDVDLDVEDSRRQELLDWLQTRFNVKQIGNYATYSVNQDEKSDGHGRGSLIVAYKKIARIRGVPKDELDAIKAIHDIPEPIRSELLALSDRKVLKSYGTHAAGVIVTTTTDELERLVPDMIILEDQGKSYHHVSQFYDDDVEALGLVKLDVLGLRTLSLLRVCSDLLGRDVGDGLDWIPLDDTRTFTTCRNGATDGVFQLEGWTAQRGCKELGIRSLKDIIVLMALYRPGVGNSGRETYLRRRQGREKQPERHQILMKHLKETYGISIFQEQVIAILRDLGLDADELTDLLKAVKASQKADIAKAVITIASYRQRVHDLAVASGFDGVDFEFLWAAIEGFSKYGFKRAHATTYGLLAYRCAYLKTHHPLEFATALLRTSEGTEKEAKYVSAVRAMGIKILRPHVNISGASYSIDRQRSAVRRGLVSIKGIGQRTAEELSANAPYESVDDIIKRCVARRVNGGKSWAKERTLNGHLGKLLEAGALGELGDEAKRD